MLNFAFWQVGMQTVGYYRCLCCALCWTWLHCGGMVAFWERMRNICPKTNIYNGPILQSDGSQCLTSKDLDCAMLATRDFWSLSPPIRIGTASLIFMKTLRHGQTSSCPTNRCCLTLCYTRKIRRLGLMDCPMQHGDCCPRSLWMQWWVIFAIS